MFPTVARRFLCNSARVLRSAERGVALVTGLLIAVFVLFLSLSMLALVERDNAFNQSMEVQIRAEMAARGGLEFFKREAELFDATPTATGTLTDPDGRYTQQFVVTYSGGDVQSVGTISQGPHVLAQHTVVAPGADFSRILDDSQ